MLNFSGANVVVHGLLTAPIEWPEIVRAAEGRADSEPEIVRAEAALSQWRHLATRPLGSPPMLDSAAACEPSDVSRHASPQNHRPGLDKNP